MARFIPYLDLIMLIRVGKRKIEPMLSPIIDLPV